jgi:hypothetical protein
VHYTGALIPIISLKYLPETDRRMRGEYADRKGHTTKDILFLLILLGIDMKEAL